MTTVQVKVYGIKSLNKYVKNLSIRLPKEVKKGMDEWGIGTQREMKRAAPVWRGNLKDSIQWKKTAKGGVLSMLNYGILLDSMRPHYVSFQNNQIRQWSLDHNFRPPWPRKLLVHPKPWISVPLGKRIGKLNQDLDKATGRAIKR